MIYTAVLVAVALGQAAQWQTFTDPQKVFTVEMPGKPEFITEPTPIKGLTRKFAKIKLDGGVFACGYIDVPKGVRVDYDYLCEMTVRQFAAPEDRQYSGPHGTGAGSKSMASARGGGIFNGREEHFFAGNFQWTRDGVEHRGGAGHRVYRIGNRIFEQLLVTDRLNAIDDNVQKRLQDSFRPVGSPE